MHVNLFLVNTGIKILLRTHKPELNSRQYLYFQKKIFSVYLSLKYLLFFKYMYKNVLLQKIKIIL